MNTEFNTLQDLNDCVLNWATTSKDITFHTMRDLATQQDKCVFVLSEFPYQAIIETIRDYERIKLTSLVFYEFNLIGSSDKANLKRSYKFSKDMLALNEIKTTFVNLENKMSELWPK